jgi:tRNA dimethylallyltransferase
MTTGSQSDALIFLVGATGAGKSAAAMELARTHACFKGRAAILAMDAMQVYRGADIGTSKPTAAERSEVPHGGLDLVDFAPAAGTPAVGSKGTFDVAQYLKHAEAFLREQRESGRRVIIVGGTGLYFRALTRGLCEAPQGSDELRAELSSLSVEELRERLGAIDPAMLGRLDEKNPRRLARAIEVFESTGRSLHEWQEETPEPLVREFTAVWIQREKAELEQRIATRVEVMFAAGWVEEVRGLVERYGLEAVRGFAGIGYREIGEALESNGIAPTIAFPNGVWERGTVKSDILVATRQYAKRQLTWFAREPNLAEVMLTGDKPFSVALRAVAPDLF